MYQFLQIKFHLLLDPVHRAHRRVHLNLHWEVYLIHSPRIICKGPKVSVKIIKRVYTS